MTNDLPSVGTALETALARIEDMLAGDDGQAFKEARKFLPVGRAALAAQPVSVPYETWLAVREGHFNAASEEYFAARPQLDSAANRRIFYAGHCKGYDAAAPTEAKPAQDAVDAERYRWVCEQDFNDRQWVETFAEFKAQRDARIDAAISAKKGGAA